MKENLVERIELTNGLILEIHDISRNIAEDTCLIAMKFRIDIEIDKKIFKTAPDESDYNRIKTKLGDKIQYEVKRERNFINKENREDIFNEVKKSFLDINLKYLSHKYFAEKYVLQQYNKKY